MGHVASGGRGTHPVVLKTVHQMDKHRGLKPIEPNREALELGAATVRGQVECVDAGSKQVIPGSGQYMTHQVQSLAGTDIRNFNRSKKAKTGKVTR